jgi:hypothetical protein
MAKVARDSTALGVDFELGFRERWRAPTPAHRDLLHKGIGDRDGNDLGGRLRNRRNKKFR